MSNRVEFFQDHDNSLKKKIKEILNNRNDLPEQILQSPKQYRFYFCDFFASIDKPFIYVLHELGILLHQQTFKIFVSGYYYKKNRLKIKRKRKIPYAQIDIHCSEEEYAHTIDEPIKNSCITMIDLDYLYWYFSPECLIYGDRNSEISVLSLDESFQLPSTLENKLVPVERFVKQHEDMNLEPEVDVDAFKKALVENYHNVK